MRRYYEKRSPEEARERYEFLARGRGARMLWVCPVSTDCLSLSHGTSSQSNLFVV